MSRRHTRARRTPPGPAKLITAVDSSQTAGRLVGVPQQMCERRAAGRLTGQQREQLLRGAGLPEQFALRVVAVLGAQEIELPQRFDALLDYFHADAPPHLNDWSHGRRIA